MKTADTAPASGLRILLRDEVIRRTGLGRTALHYAERAGAFPSRVAISARRIGWLESEVDAWIRDRIKSRLPAPVPRGVKGSAA